MKQKRKGYYDREQAKIINTAFNKYTYSNKSRSMSVAEAADVLLNGNVVKNNSERLGMVLRLISNRRYPYEAIKKEL